MPHQQPVQRSNRTVLHRPHNSRASRYRVPQEPTQHLTQQPVAHLMHARAHDIPRRSRRGQTARTELADISRQEEVERRLNKVDRRVGADRLLN